MPRFLEIAARLWDTALSEWFQAECFGCGEISPRAVCKACWVVRPVEFLPGSPVHTVLCYQEPWRSVLHAIKFQNHEALLKLFRTFCEQTDLSYLPKETVVVPVPMHTGTYRRRGFNPCEPLARWLATSHGLRFEPDLLRKTRGTQVQSTLSAKERLLNPRSSYLCRASESSVLLVDDIVTTGATLASATRALLQGGVKEVYPWALFRA
ncbi:hypothetical protein K2X33_02590 [bacterium]|nr:hypothetical protein [bacterium]